MNLRSCCSKLCSILRPGIDKILYFCIWNSLSCHITSSPSSKPVHIAATERKPGIELVQAPADISRSTLCCHSNETRAPIANLHKSAQLEGTPYHSSNLHPGPCSSVGMRRWTDRHTDRPAQTAVTTIHFASATPHAKFNEVNWQFAVLNVFRTSSV